MGLLEALIDDQGMETDKIMRLCDVARETSYEIHRYHRHGHLEKIYANALTHRLRKQGYKVIPEHHLQVYD
jgi:hypothetical protein